MPGVNPIRTYPDETRKKAKGPIRQEPQVIERYRHWLHDLDCQMQDRAEDAVSESIAKKEFFNRVDIFDQFRDKSKAMRQKWREFKQESSSMKQGSIRHPREEIKNHAHLPINYDQLILSVLSTSNKIEQNQVSRPSMKASKRKPAWARTENENELEQEKEIEGLVDFMDNFDAREYVEDVEVKSILANIQEKVKEHEASIRSEIKKKGVSSSKAENKNDINPFSGIQNNSNDRSKKGVAHPMPFRPSTSDPRKSMMEDYSEKMKAQIIKRIADSILKTDPVKHSNKELSKIHSNASLRRLIEGLVQNYFQENKYVLDRYVLPSHKSPITRVPRTITHDNSKFKTLNSVQSLPYLYPSPLI